VLGADRRDLRGDDLGSARNLFERRRLVCDLDAHLRGVLGEKGSTGRNQAGDAQRSLDAPAALVGAQLADDARHVRRHVLDDPDAQLDRLDRRAVVDADLAIQGRLDVVAAPAAVVGRRRGLFQSPITTSLHHDLLRSRDALAEILIGIQPQHVARKRGGRIAPLLEGRIRPQPLPDIAPDLQHEPSSNVTHNACWLRSHRSFLRLLVSGRQLGQHLLHDDRCHILPLLERRVRAAPRSHLTRNQRVDGHVIP
jgi:hypothetical protein